MAYTNIDDPSAYFKAVKYTGNGTEPRNIDVGFQSDFIWTKDRTVGYHHRMFDSSRGNVGPLYPNNNSAEDGYNDGPEIDFSSPNSNGFKIIDNPDGTTNSYGVNINNSEIISWNWKTNGGTTSSNTDGNITSTVQVNQDAGFSIVTYTGNGTDNQTIGHGLGVQPNWWLVKRRDTTGGWMFGASSILGGTSNYLALDDTAGNTEINNIWGDSPTSSTLFRVSNNARLNANNGTYVAYLFADKQGYSKFGKYVGNGSTDGAFVYLGFKPAFVILKRINTTSNWIIMDSKRNAFNEMESRVFPNLADAEQTQSTYGLDFLSNGFKLRDTVSQSNGSSSTYIYIAFAENPFTTSTGVPTTAR